MLPANGHPNLQDVALSLCALGRGGSACSSDGSIHKDARDDGMNKMNPNSVRESAGGTSSIAATVYPAASMAGNNANVPSIPAYINRLKISDHVSPHVAPAPKKEIIATKRGSSIKYNMKPKYPKRGDGSVPFEEMKRLMRVYGSLKCLRNRTPQESGKTVKLDSIKRKFYRWFPDFEERFEKTPDGWYQPKLGHEHEMRYREEMRRQDQQILVKKRNSGRESNLGDSNLL